MTTETEVTRFVPADGVKPSHKMLETASEEANDYKFMRAGDGCSVCKHGGNAYLIIEKMSPDGVPVIGCSCKAWTHAHDLDGCKHVAVFQHRSRKPTAQLDADIARDLMAAGWTGGKGNLQPPNTEAPTATKPEAPTATKPGPEVVAELPPMGTTPDGEDNTGSDPVPPEAEKPEHAVIVATCEWCGKKIEHSIISELQKLVEEHEATCPKNPANKQKSPRLETQEAPKQPQKATVSETETIETPEEEPKMAEEETKTYTHPDGTVFETAEALLDYEGKQKTTQTAEATPFDTKTFIAPMIKNLGAPQLSEIGGIRIGKKRQGGGAETFDHFIFTTPDKDPVTGDFYRDEEMTALYGDDCREIPVRFMSDDITEIFTTFYAEYGAGGIKIRGDGENWVVTNPDGSKTYIEDPNGEHGFLKNPNVKPQGILTVLVDGQKSVGTVYRFRTTGWNSIKGMLASLALCAKIAERAGGRIAFLPMLLIYRTKEVTPKGERYKKRIPVVTVEFRGTVDELKQQSRDASTYLGTSGDHAQLPEGVVYDADAETLEEMEDVRAEFFPEED